MADDDEFESEEEQREWEREERLWDVVADVARSLVARAIELWGQPEKGTSEYHSWRSVIDEQIWHADELFRREPDRLAQRIEMVNGKQKRRPISGAVRTQVFERDAYRCVKCGSWENLTVDHIIPVIAGGEHSPDNFQTLCGSCNSAKGARI